MNNNVHERASFENRYEEASKPDWRKRMTTLGAVAMGVGMAFGAAQLGSHLVSENERINDPAGTERHLSDDECVSIQIGSKLREDADARDSKYEMVERVYVVEDAPIALCGLKSVRLKSNTDGIGNMIGLSGESLLEAGLPPESVEPLVENGESKYVWVLKSDENASVVKEKDLP